MFNLTEQDREWIASMMASQTATLIETVNGNSFKSEDMEKILETFQSMNKSIYKIMTAVKVTENGDSTTERQPSSTLPEESGS